jgi:hypothetical protein
MNSSSGTIILVQGIKWVYRLSFYKAYPTNVKCNSSRESFYSRSVSFRLMILTGFFSWHSTACINSPSVAINRSHGLAVSTTPS